VQQDHRPQRHGEDDRAEFRRRHREGRHARHQHHHKRGLLRSDQRAAEREHGPIGDHHAHLRQQIDRQHVLAAQAVDDVGQPERQRRPEISAERVLVPNRNDGRELPGRRSVEQPGHQRPQERLHNRGQRHRERGTRAQQLDQNGNVKHQPRTVP
jgi:hypothetical protein